MQSYKTVAVVVISIDCRSDVKRANIALDVAAQPRGTAARSITLRMLADFDTRTHCTVPQRCAHTSITRYNHATSQQHTRVRRPPSVTLWGFVERCGPQTAVQTRDSRHLYVTQRWLKCRRIEVLPQMQVWRGCKRLGNDTVAALDAPTQHSLSNCATQLSSNTSNNVAREH